LCYSVQNQAFYRTGIFGNFFFGGGNFAFSKREFPVALPGAQESAMAVF